jgi:hypothetical protein
MEVRCVKISENLLDLCSGGRNADSNRDGMRWLYIADSN